MMPALLVTSVMVPSAKVAVATACLVSPRFMLALLTVTFKLFTPPFASGELGAIVLGLVAPHESISPHANRVRASRVKGAVFMVPPILPSFNGDAGGLDRPFEVLLRNQRAVHVEAVGHELSCECVALLVESRRHQE